MIRRTLTGYIHRIDDEETRAQRAAVESRNRKPQTRMTAALAVLKEANGWLTTGAVAQQIGMSSNCYSVLFRLARYKLVERRSNNGTSEWRAL